MKHYITSKIILFPSIKIIIISLCLITGTLLVYRQVSTFSFVNFDDNLYVEDNQHVKKGLTLENIRWAFTEATNITNFWAPLTWLSIIVDYELYGMNAGGYHVTNLIIHIANTLLVLLVMYKMAGSLWKSAFIAAMFALHPLHVESVAWVTERKDVLSALFWFLTMWAYASYAKVPSLKNYLFTLLFFIMGLMSKPMLVTLPFAMLLLDLWPLNRFKNTKTPIQFFRSLLLLIPEKIFFFIIITFISIAAFLTQDKGGALPSTSLIPPLLRLENVIVSYAKYLWQTIWPFDLSVARLYPRFLPLWQVVLSTSTILSITALSIYCMVKKKEWVIVGWLWYLGTLVPVIGIVVIADQAMADRYTYIPHIGIFIILAWGIPQLIGDWKYKKVVLATGASVYLLLLGIMTANQLQYWKNSTTLFNHAIAVTGNNYIAYNNLGLAYHKKGEMLQAIEMFKKSIKDNPGYHAAYNNIGVVMESIGIVEHAINFYKKAIQVKPEFKDPYVNMAFILLHTGDIRGAIKYSKQAIELDSRFTEAYIILGDAYQKIGRLNESNFMYNQAILLDPQSAPAHTHLGEVLLKLNKIEKSISHFQNAYRLQPIDKNYKENLDKAIKLQKTIEQKINDTLNEIKTKPYSESLYFNLGVLYLRKDSVDKALSVFQEILSLSPDHIPTLIVISDLYADRGDFQKSNFYLKKILSLQPKEKSYLYNIACLYAKHKHINESVNWLEKALKNGYSNWKQIEIDPDLSNIRDTKEYNEIVKKYKTNKSEKHTETLINK